MNWLLSLDFNHEEIQMSFRIALLRLLIVVTFGLMQIVAYAGDKPDGSQSLRAYELFKQSLIDRFDLPEQPVGLPNNEVESLDCQISIIDTRQSGERIVVQVIRADEVRTLAVYLGKEAKYSENQTGFKFALYNETCEERGCDNDWYPYATLFVGPKILKLTNISTYSRATSVVSCILL
jgi:hypothetical protein